LLKSALGAVADLERDTKSITANERNYEYVARKDTRQKKAEIEEKVSLVTAYRSEEVDRI